MKALSVIKPWGDLIVSGEKSLEIRSWKPTEVPMLNVALVQNSTRLMKDGEEDIDGQVIAIIDIIACKPWVKSDCNLSGCDESEFEEGWLAWEVANVRPLRKTTQAIAKRKFYELSCSEVEAINRVIEGD